ncbi:MAG: transcriptional repressor LexA [Oligoflexia bacterium]|nr:transcriptional repressor LexA [Oligoflexia bacterium]
MYYFSIDCTKNVLHHRFMITPKQKLVLEFLQKFIHENGYAPSYQEIANAFGFSSRSTAQKYVERLRESGFLDSETNAKRSVSVKQSGIHLPLLGRVAAGRPIEYHIHQEFVEVPSSFIQVDADHFCLIVDGDSMINEGILSGDYAVVRKQDHASDGSIVVASISGESTLKKMIRKRNKIELHAANPKYAPLVVLPEADFRIEGVLTGVLRNLHSTR